MQDWLGLGARNGLCHVPQAGQMGKILPVILIPRITQLLKSGIHNVQLEVVRFKFLIGAVLMGQAQDPCLSFVRSIHARAHHAGLASSVRRLPVDTARGDDDSGGARRGAPEAHERVLALRPRSGAGANRLTASHVHRRPRSPCVPATAPARSSPTPPRRRTLSRSSKPHRYLNTYLAQQPFAPVSVLCLRRPIQIQIPMFDPARAAYSPTLTLNLSPSTRPLLETAYKDDVRAQPGRVLSLGGAPGAMGPVSSAGRVGAVSLLKRTSSLFLRALVQWLIVLVSITLLTVREADNDNGNEGGELSAPVSAKSQQRAWSASTSTTAPFYGRAPPSTVTHASTATYADRARISAPASAHGSSAAFYDSASPLTRMDPHARFAFETLPSPSSSGGWGGPATPPASAGDGGGDAHVRRPRQGSRRVLRRRGCGVRPGAGFRWGAESPLQRCGDGYERDGYWVGGGMGGRQSRAPGAPPAGAGGV
ncbi:hypothetical protein FB451DRAFT_1195269 [Mycena latifolia]|nr:hypothetical protein FB451DRAFT_1195269 [Mycena latifolia]